MKWDKKEVVIPLPAFGRAKYLYDFCIGELKLKSSKRYYKGECMEDIEYWEQKHEIRARYMEKVLYNEYIEYKNKSK